MKTNKILHIATTLLISFLFTNTSCQQREIMAETDLMNNTGIENNVSRSEAVIFNITSTETGTLANLMSNAASEKGCQVGDVTELTISGKVSFDDLRSLRSLTRLTKLDLTSITVYDEYENLCDYLPYGVFNDFTSPAHIIIPTSIISLTGSCFQNGNIVGITLHNDITTIDGHVFSGCQKLKEVIDWPTKVTTIPYSCFWECRSLNFEIPTRITTIQDHAFYSCNSITDITIPDGVTEIHANAFQSCTSLTHLTIPSTVTRVGEYIVGDCYMLKVIRWNSTIDIPRLFFEWNDYSSLIYAPTGITSHSGNKNVIIGDETNGYFTKHIELSEYSDFSCPIPFTAETAVYRKFYSSTTLPGETAGWNTLTLPFDVTKIIVQETGDQPERTLKPFGSEEMGDAKPFWLRTLSEDGFVRSTKIEAGTPYLIAFPNNSSYYLPEYNIWGTIEYWGENVTVVADTDIKFINGPNFDMCGTYKKLNKSMNIYNIDYDEFRDDMYGLYFHGGSLFRSSIRATEPFEAYLTNNNGSTRSYIPIEGNGSTRSSGAFNNIPSDNDM